MPSVYQFRQAAFRRLSVPLYRPAAHVSHAYRDSLRLYRPESMMRLTHSAILRGFSVTCLFLLRQEQGGGLPVQEVGYPPALAEGMAPGRRGRNPGEARPHARIRTRYPRRALKATLEARRRPHAGRLFTGPTG